MPQLPKDFGGGYTVGRITPLQSIQPDRVPSKPKYRSVKTEVDGLVFSSKKEALRYSALRILVNANIISNLVLQEAFDIIVNGIKVCRYVADFSYTEDGVRIIEDVKGFKTPVYRLKKKLMKAVHGIEITES
jgi:hypothetical protein